jgi:hypothetical protein
VKVRWHWIGHRSKGRLVSGDNAVSVFFPTTKWRMIRKVS